MLVRRLTETLILVSDPDWDDVPRLCRAMNASIYPGVEEVTASYDTIGIYGRPAAGWENWIASCLGQAGEGCEPHLHEIPVCYEMGEDLAEAAGKLGLSTQQLVELHQSVEYKCFAVGFQPGFAYLGPLPRALQGLPRRESPRMRVEPGSVGICQDQTAVYPNTLPGGWNLIGRSPIKLVNVDENYFPIEAGDLVRFRQINQGQFEELRCQRLT